MTDLDGERFSFLVEWFDALSQITRQYYLNYYINSKSTEMIDVRTRKLFLKKSKVENLCLDDLYVGSTIHIYCRPLTVVDYGDEFTRKKLSSKKEKTITVIKPNAVDKIGEIISIIIDRGFAITKMRMCQLDRKEAGEFYAEHLGQIFYETLLSFLSSGPIIILELMASDAIQRWRNTIGPADPEEAKKTAPDSIRARYSIDKIKNSVHGSDSPAAVARDTEFFFPTSGVRRQNTAMYKDSTCCIIKPHAVAEGLAGRIIHTIQKSGFEISALSIFYLEKANAEEFLEVYKGVVYEYPAMVDELRMGPCVVMEVHGGADTPTAFRELVGPMDPEIARHLRPKTLRALFGKDKIKNAIHCTDLPEDALLEVEYFFKILDS